MLVCFGIAWPINLLCMLRSRRIQGSGLKFTLIIGSGYVAGAASKLALWATGSLPLSPLFWLYVLNGVTVGLNAWLQYRLQQSERLAGQPT